MSRPPLEVERLLFPGEVAKLFRVDVVTVNRWAKAGKLRCIRTLGGHRRYVEAEVHQLLGRQSETTERPPDSQPAWDATCVCGCIADGHRREHGGSGGRVMGCCRHHTCVEFIRADAA